MAIAIILLCLLVSTIQPIYAHESLLLEIAGERKTDNSLIVQSIELLFNDENGTFLLGNGDGHIEFTIEDMTRLRVILEKYLSWEELAVINQIKLYKDIPESMFFTDIVYNKTNDNEYIKEKINFKMSFYSMSENDHYLVIESKVFEKKTFGFLDEPYYISKSRVQEIYNSINEKNIDKYIEEHKNSEKLQELFK